MGRVPVLGGEKAVQALLRRRKRRVDVDPDALQTLRSDRDQERLGRFAAALEIGEAGADEISARQVYAPWHFLNFLPEPHQHGSLRPSFSCSPTVRCVGAWSVLTVVAPPPSAPAIASAPIACSCSYERSPFPAIIACCSCAARSCSASSG